MMKSIDQCDYWINLQAISGGETLGQTRNGSHLSKCSECVNVGASKVVKFVLWQYPQMIYLDRHL